MSRDTRFVPPGQTITVKGLLPAEVPVVQDFVACYTDALGVSVHADRSDPDKDARRSLVYCNFKSPGEAANALEGLTQCVFANFAKISEYHQVLPLAACLGALCTHLRTKCKLGEVRAWPLRR